MGFIVIDYAGRVIHSWVRYTITLFSEEVEVIVLYRALQYAKHRKTIAIYIKRDVKTIIDAFNSKDYNLVNLNAQHILQDTIKSLSEFSML